MIAVAIISGLITINQSHRRNFQKLTSSGSMTY
jgi:hypothetical protein